MYKSASVFLVVPRGKYKTLKMGDSMKNLRIIALMAFVFVTMAAPVSAQNMTRKIDGFDFFVDDSSSMQESYDGYGGSKREVAAEVLGLVNAEIPDLGYEASMHSFSDVMTFVPYGPWNQSGMAEQIMEYGDRFTVMQRTGLGDGLLETAPAIHSMARPTGLIIVSDGENNIGINPVTELRMLYEANPDLCAHVISVATSETGQALLDELAGMKPCSVSVTANELLASHENLEQFVKDVFYNEMDEVLVLRGVNFAFDSSTLDAEAKAILDQAALLLIAENKPVVLQGWTDYIGSEQYNRGLSMRRAEAVKQYLVSRGVPAALMTTEGMGISHKFDNSTAEGRYLNRRTEILF